jgi:hypothetical protein
LVEIDNSRLKLVLVPTRGMGLWYAELDGTRLGWESPVRGPIHPHFVPINEPSGVGWLDGFDELMVRCGLESSGGAVFNERGQLVFPLHGRIANRPARELSVSVDDVSGAIEVSGIVDEIRFNFQKLRLKATLTTSFGSTTFGWHDQVENLGGNIAKMQMLYHVNIGHPLLAPGAQLLAPVRVVSPHDRNAALAGTKNYHTYPPQKVAPAHQSYFFDLLADERGDTRVLLTNPSGNSGVGLRFNKRELPCFTQWQNNVMACDGYVTALEPATNFPNPRSFEEQHERIVNLSPGSVWNAQVMVDWHTDIHSVSDACHAIRALQGDTQPEIHDAPTKSWSPNA